MNFPFVSSSVLIEGLLVSGFCLVYASPMEAAELSQQDLILFFES